MLREFEGEDRVVVGDLEAGVGTLLRMGERGADLAIVVAQPTAKSMEVARRGLVIAASREVPAILVANRVAAPGDEQLMRDTLRPTVPMFSVPDDPAVARADEDGASPLDTAPGSPAVLALEDLAHHVLEDGRLQPT